MFTTMSIQKDLVDKYKDELMRMDGGPDWAVHKRFEQDKIVSCSIPFVGDEFFEQEKRVLIYASAEVLSEYYPGNDKCNRTWLDDDDIAINRHRWFFDNDLFQADSCEPSGKRFFPNVHIQPMEDGALPTAAAFILSKLGVKIDGDPRMLYEKIAFGNYGKFTRESAYQEKLRKCGSAGKDVSKQNIDYAGDRSYLEASHGFVAIDMEFLKPDIIIMPKSIYKTDRDFLESVKGNATIIPIIQMNAGNINRLIKGKYELVCERETDANVLSWYNKLHDNGINGKTKENYRYVFGYLESVLKEVNY